MGKEVFQKFRYIGTLIEVPRAKIALTHLSSCCHPPPTQRTLFSKDIEKNMNWGVPQWWEVWALTGERKTTFRLHSSTLRKEPLSQGSRRCREGNFDFQYFRIKGMSVEDNL